MDVVQKKYKHVGVAQIYPWRPHASQRNFLLRLAREYGLQTSELVCGGSFTKCYDKQFATVGLHSIDHCIKCRLGRRNPDSLADNFFIDWSLKDSPVPDEERAILSNVAALTRAELPEDALPQAGNRGILEAYRAGYHSTISWIEELEVDLILLFNGRIDILKGVMDAARDCGVDFMSYERSWFGDGIWLVPFDNCLGMSRIHDVCKQISHVSLTEEQTESALTIIKQRVDRTGSKEWRNFQNSGDKWSQDVLAEIGSAPEVLVLPSSTYEYWGHPDFESSWSNNFEAIDALQQRLNVPYSKFAIRGHPIWAQRVGPKKGTDAVEHYRNFCRQRGIRFVEPSSSLHTSALIDSCQLVVLNSGTSVLEAVWRGKPVVSLTPSPYEFSNVCATFTDPNDPIIMPDDHERKEGIIRFAFAVDKIIPTYSAFLKATSSIDQEEYAGANFQDVIDQVAGRTLNIPQKWFQTAGEKTQITQSNLSRLRNILKTGDR